MLNFCDFIQVYVFSTNHHLKEAVGEAILCKSTPNDLTRKIYYAKLLRVMVLGKMSCTIYLDAIVREKNYEKAEMLK